jgi:hypothetical protein
MDVDRYDEYVRGPAHEVVTVETRIKPSNIGFAMLARMGWQEGQPVGLSGDGLLDPRGALWSSSHALTRSRGPHPIHGQI